MPHAVPGHAQVGVGRVLAERDPAVREIAAELGPADFQQRPHQGPGPRPHPREPGRPGAADETEQHRLRLVVDGVPQRHPAGPQLGRRPREEGVAHVMAGALDRDAARPRHVGHRHRLDEAGHAEPAREVPAEALVLVRRRPAQPVIDVGHAGQGQEGTLGQLREEMEQRHRVAAARHRRHDPPPARDQRLPFHRRGYAVGE